jgi:hypothetical protein
MGHNEDVARSCANAQIHPGGVASVLVCLDKSTVRVGVTDLCRRSVAGRVIDDDDLVCRNLRKERVDGLADRRPESVMEHDGHCHEAEA